MCLQVTKHGHSLQWDNDLNLQLTAVANLIIDLVTFNCSVLKTY